MTIENMPLKDWLKWAWNLPLGIAIAYYLYVLGLDDAWLIQRNVAQRNVPVCDEGIV